MESQLPGVARHAAAEHLLAARDVLDIARAVANGGAARARVDVLAALVRRRLRRHAAGRVDDRSLGGGLVGRVRCLDGRGRRRVLDGLSGGLALARVLVFRRERRARGAADADALAAGAVRVGLSRDLSVE